MKSGEKKKQRKENYTSNFQAIDMKEENETQLIEFVEFLKVKEASCKSKLEEEIGEEEILPLEKSNNDHMSSSGKQLKYFLNNFLVSTKFIALVLVNFCYFFYAYFCFSTTS